MNLATDISEVSEGTCTCSGVLGSSSMSFRSQLQGFALGSAIVGAFAMYQLQKDVWSSHRMILAAVQDKLKVLEEDVKQIKATNEKEASTS